MMRVIRLLAILILLIAGYVLYGNQGEVGQHGADRVERERPAAEPPAWVLHAPDRR